METETACRGRGEEASETLRGNAKKVLGRYLSAVLVVVGRRLPLGRLAHSLRVCVPRTPVLPSILADCQRARSPPDTGPVAATARERERENDR